MYNYQVTQLKCSPGAVKPYPPRGGPTGSRREGYDYYPLTILGHMQAIPTVEGRCYDRTLNSINSINSINLISRNLESTF